MAVNKLIIFCTLVFYVVESCTLLSEEAGEEFIFIYVTKVVRFCMYVVDHS